MKSEFEIAITQLSADRNLAPEVIIEAIETALVSAYKKNYGPTQTVRVNLDSRTGQAKVFVTQTVVEEPEAEHDDQISLAEARTHKADAQLGDEIEVEVMPRNFGRIAAQTAKQVITQRIREAERDSVYLAYADRAGEIVTATVRNVDARSHNVTLNMGKAEALLPRAEQIPTERYRFSQRVRVYIVSVDKAGHGPQILVSRTHRDLLRRLLELEVPEIHNGTVEVKSIAREPGARSKVAVAALQHGVDPVGSCVGMRGVRIQNIVNELNGEKIDVVEWSSNLEVFIANALSPAKATSVHLNQAENTAQVVVPDRSLSLAIGKEGQNARLAAKLTGWRIDITSETEAEAAAERLAAEREEARRKAQELQDARRAAAELLASAEALLVAEGEEAEEAEELSEQEAIARDVALSHAEPEQVVEAEVQVSEATAMAEPELTPTAAVEEPAQTVWEPAVEEPVGEPLEAIEAAIAPVIEGDELALEDDEEQLPLEEEDEDGSKARERDKRKNRSRSLEFDERLGRVVAKKRRKDNRRQGWGDDYDDEAGA
jgi:N utilization substance protein A